MNDILTLIIVPILVLMICIMCAVLYTNRIATSNELQWRIAKISKRQRVIRADNHRLCHINKLMLPENEKDFVEDMAKLVSQSYKVSNRNML